MSLTLSQSYKAVGPGLQVSFLAGAGSEPYVYSVVAGGAGGTIDPDTGLYSAPIVASSDVKRIYDVIQAQDSLGAKAFGRVLVGNPLLLFCDILQTELGLDDRHIYLWDQKIMQPTDSSLYIAVSVISSKPFGNTNKPDGSGSGLDAVQSVNMFDTLGLDLISRGPEARDRKFEVILALNSDYAQSQQELNSFKIGQLPAGSQFVNLSEIDGAAIPYRFRIQINMQYFAVKVKPVPYIDDFSPVVVTTES